MRSRKAKAATSDARDRSGRFQPGNTAAVGNAGGGRPPNEARKAAEDFFAGFVPEAETRLMALIRSVDPAVSLRACSLVFAYVHGRPRQTLELVGDGAAILDVIDKAKADAAKEAAEAAHAAGKSKGARK